jgi:putative endonuclease
MPAKQPAPHAPPTPRATPPPRATPSSRATPRPRSERGADPRRALGRLGEDLAAAHLGRLGLRTLARNVRTRYGEIDLIACDGHTLVFAEVKTRRVRSRDRRVRPDQEPLPGLRKRQRKRLRRLALAWLSSELAERPSVRTIRFDAVGVIVDGRGQLLRLDHIEGAW